MPDKPSRRSVRTAQGQVDDISPLQFLPLSPPSRRHRLSFEALNHSDPDELLAHKRLVPAEHLSLLKAGLNKIDAYRERFAHPDDEYSLNLALVATSNWDLSRRFSLCGIKNHLGRSQPCSIWNLCPACSFWKRKLTTLTAYLTRFHRTSWFMVTISYNKMFSDGRFDEDEVRLCWQAAAQALYDLQVEGSIRGTMTRSELHLERFLPMQCHPHIHSVVDADEIDRAKLAERVFEYRHRDTGGQITFPVSIKARRLGNEKAFANALSYLGKPLNVAHPYVQAWPEALKENRRLAPELNYQVDEFLDALSIFTAGTRQTRYTGTLHAASRDTLRVRPARRKAERELVWTILTDSVVDDWDDDEPEQAEVFSPPTGLNLQPG